MILKDISQIMDKSSQKSLQLIYNSGESIKKKELFRKIGRTSGITGATILKNTGLIRETLVSSFWGKKEGYELTSIGKYLAIMLKSENNRLYPEESKYLENYDIFNEIFEIKKRNSILEALYNSEDFITYNQLVKSSGINNGLNQELNYLNNCGMTNLYKKGMGLLYSSYDYKISELGRKVYENYNNLNLENANLIHIGDTKNNNIKHQEVPTKEILVENQPKVATNILIEKNELEKPEKNENLIKNKFPPRNPHPNFNPYVNDNHNDLSKKDLGTPSIEEDIAKTEFKKLCNKKGKDFENYVMDNLFPKESFDLLYVTPDAKTNERRYVECSRKPDLQFRDKKTGNIFYVECKYRSRLFNEKFEWASNVGQAERYRNIEYLEEIPVYVAMGLMGASDNPKKVFLMPLKDIKYSGLFLSVLRNYEITESRDVFKILK
ncbi:hypothetical protein GYY_03160 [Methanococcus maripaludis X1]|uniref:Uncharacterized protein n=1 Tax=Methanococcus maripaludis X1 TaxID=1053692 RepID=G0H445_METMI|nr:hypothetical protein [Methanococcus maripaludis]AEK19511.1 hypothetical protein GYY_03160 [Methanococcus maripaludis X1]